MRERFALLALPLMLVFLAGGCGGEATSETEVPVTPIAAVADWLGAIADDDLDTIDRLVDPVDLALLAGAENAFTREQLAAVAATGLPEATRSSYWQSFADGFEEVLGMPLDEVTIVGAEEFTSAGERYAAVTVGVGDATTEVITHLVDGAWQVDLVATAGPALAVPIRRLVTDLAASEDEATARTYALGGHRLARRRPRLVGRPQPRAGARSDRGPGDSHRMSRDGGGWMTSPGVSRILS